MTGSRATGKIMSVDPMLYFLPLVDEETNMFLTGPVLGSGSSS